MATAPASHMEGQLPPLDGTQAACPWGGATHACALILTCQGGCSQTRDAVRDPDAVCTMLCACKPKAQGVHT